MTEGSRERAEDAPGANTCLPQMPGASASKRMLRDTGIPVLNPWSERLTWVKDKEPQ